MERIGNFLRSAFFLQSSMIPAPIEESMKFFRRLCTVLFYSFLLPNRGEVITFRNHLNLSKWPQDMGVQSGKMQMRDSSQFLTRWTSSSKIQQDSLATPLPNLSTKRKDTLIRKPMFIAYISCIKANEIGIYIHVIYHTWPCRPECFPLPDWKIEHCSRVMTLGSIIVVTAISTCVYIAQLSHMIHNPLSLSTIIHNIQIKGYRPCRRPLMRKQSRGGLRHG